MVTQDMDINTDPGCSKTTDPDKTLGGSMDLDITWPQVAFQATQINMPPPPQRGSMTQEHQHNFKLQHRPGTSA